MQKIKNLVVTTKGKDGKKYYKTIGAIFKRDDGSMAYLIDALGTGVWASAYDPMTPEEIEKLRQKKQEEPQTNAETLSKIDDSIPF